MEMKITDAEIADMLKMCPTDCTCERQKALMELQDRRKQDAVAVEILTQLKEVRRRIENSESWWMDCPDRGGFDTDVIDAAIQRAEEAGIGK